MIQHPFVKFVRLFHSQSSTLYGSTVKLHNDQYVSCVINEIIPYNYSRYSMQLIILYAFMLMCHLLFHTNSHHQQLLYLRLYLLAS